jgi:hypothetical protein
MSNDATRRHALYATACVLMLIGPSASAQQKDALILLTRADTFSVERFSRTARQLESELVIRAAGARLTLRATLGESGRVQTLTSEARAATADRSSPPSQQVAVTFVGDSAVAELGTGAARTVQRFGSRAGAVPFVNPSFAFVELAIRSTPDGSRHRRRQALPAGGRTVDAKVIRVEALGRLRL